MIPLIMRYLLLILLLTSPFITANEKEASECVQIEDIHSIDDVTYSYLTVAYSATENINVSLSVSNLFDKEPPYFKDFFGFVDPQINTPQNTYDVVGRYYTLGFKLTY